MSTELIEIPFYAQKIQAVETPDGAYVPLKPICEAFGLDWSAQLKRLKKRPKVYGMEPFAIPSKGGIQETVCIPVNRLAMWLALIQIRKVKEELRDMLELYQIEAADVLDRHFRQKQSLLKQQHHNLVQHCLMSKPAWAKVYFHQQAGIEENFVWRFMRRPSREVEALIEEMTALGIISKDGWRKHLPNPAKKCFEWEVWPRQNNTPQLPDQNMAGVPGKQATPATADQTNAEAH